MRPRAAGSRRRRTMQASARSLRRRTVVSASAHAGQVGQRDQDMRLELQAPQAPSSRRSRSRLRRARRRRCPTGCASSRSATVLSKSASSISGRRRTQSRRKGDRSKTAARKSRCLPCRISRAASLGSSASAADVGDRRRVSSAAASAVERRQRHRSGLQAQVRPAGLRCRSAVSFVIRPWLRRKRHDRRSARDSRRQEFKPATMKLHDRLGKAEAKTGARLRAAFLEPDEALGGAIAVDLVGNARAVVGHAEPHLAARTLDDDADFRAAPVASAEYLIALSTRLDSAWPISSRLPSITADSLSAPRG